MAWQKIPQEHHPIFYDALPPGDSRVSTIKMFGGLCGVVNGHMACGLWADSAVIRLPDRERAEVLAMAGASAFDPMGKGKAMTEMVVLPAKVFKDINELRRWMKAAVDYTDTLPPKPKKKPRKTALKKEAAAKKKAAPKQKAAPKKAAPKKAPQKAPQKAAPKKAAPKKAAPKKK